MKIFLNDRIMDESAAVISVFDHGFLYGDGIYETMRAYEGRVFMLERHIERLFRSASLIKLHLPEAEVIREAVYETVRANDLSSAYIRITVSRGKGPIGLDPALCPSPTFVVAAQEFGGYPEAYYQEGVKLIIANTRRNLVQALDPKIKSLNFLNNILAKMEAKEQGAYEALMLNAGGFLAEGTVSNIFFVKDNIVCTPSLESGVLDGITRELVIRLAGQHGIEVIEGSFRPEDIYGASEVFFTNTTTEVMPVSRIDNVVFPVGPVAKVLRRSYAEEVGRFLTSD